MSKTDRFDVETMLFFSYEDFLAQHPAVKESSDLLVECMAAGLAGLGAGESEVDEQRADGRLALRTLTEVAFRAGFAAGARKMHDTIKEAL